MVSNIGICLLFDIIGVGIVGVGIVGVGIDGVRIVGVGIIGVGIKIGIAVVGIVGP